MKFKKTTKIIGFISLFAVFAGIGLRLAANLLPSAEQTVFNVTDYGAQGEWHDDTAAFQAAFAAATASSAPNRVVYIPSGKYIIKQTLTIERQSHITLQGGGAGSAIIMWTGAQSGTMLAVRGVQDSRLTGFTLWGDGTTTGIRYDGLADMASMHNVFDELTIYGQAFGIRIGADHFQASDTLFRRSFAFGTTNIGTSIEDPKSIHLDFKEVIWTQGRKGIAAQAGHFNLYGCSVSSTTDVGIEVAPSPVETIISHSWTEQGTTFLRVLDGQPTTVTLIEASVNTLDPGKKMMEFLNPGTLNIVGGFFRVRKTLPGQIEIGNHPDLRTRINVIGASFEGNPFSESPLLARGMATVHLTGIQLDNGYNLHDPAQTDSLMSIGTQRKPLIASAPLQWAGGAWLMIPSGTQLQAGVNAFTGSSLNADGSTGVRVDAILPSAETMPVDIAAEDSGSQRFVMRVHTASGMTLAHDLVFHVVFDVMEQPVITDPAPPLDDTPLFTPIVETGTGHFFNVKDFGAMGDGVTDDTDAIQRAIDAAEKDFYYVFAGSKGTVYLPAGTYKITKQILVRAEGGQNFIGEDMDRTKIVWAGAASGTMLAIQGVANGHIGKFTLIGDGQTTRGIDYDGIPGDSDTHGSHADFNMFEHIRIQDQDTCLSISKLYFQTDITDYEYMQFLRCKTYGVVIYDANAVMHNFYHSLWEDNGFGVNLIGTGGSYSIIDGMFRRSREADFLHYPSGRPTLYLRVHSEGSKIFLGTAGGTNAVSQHTFIDCMVDSVSPVFLEGSGMNGPVPSYMWINATGGTTIIGGSFTSGQLQPGQILHVGASNRGNLTIIGTHFDGNPLLSSANPWVRSMSTVLRQTSFGGPTMDGRYDEWSEDHPLLFSEHLVFAASAWLKIPAGTVMKAGQNTLTGSSMNALGRTKIAVDRVNATAAGIGAKVSAYDAGNNTFRIVVTVPNDVTLSQDIVFHILIDPEAAEAVPVQPIVPHVDVLGPTSATISWTTPVPTDWQVYYGSTPGFGTLNWIYFGWITSQWQWDDPLTTHHTQSLTDLTPGTLYHFYVRSQDATGVLSVSNDLTFRTQGTEGPAPVTTAFSQVTVSDQTETGAVIHWTTDRAVGTQLEYGPGIIYETMTDLDTSPLTAHQVTLKHLIPGTRYHFRIRTDYDDNSGDFTFMTTYPTIDPACDQSFTKVRLIGQKGTMPVYIIPSLLDCTHLAPNALYIVKTADLSSRPFSASIVRATDGLPADFALYRYSSADAHAEQEHRLSPVFSVRFPGTFAASPGALAHMTLSDFATEHGVTWLPVDHSQQAITLEPHSLYIIRTGAGEGGMTLGIH